MKNQEYPYKIFMNNNFSYICSLLFTEHMGSHSYPKITVY